MPPHPNLRRLDTRADTKILDARSPQGRESSSCHRYELDMVRLATVLGVIAVHGTSLLLPAGEGAGGILAVFHTTREVFLFLSAFVLAYSAKGVIVARSFWRRRFPLVVAPYVAWSATYVLADGTVHGAAGTLSLFARDLLSGAARFHLYFLLLTFQLYLVFPWVHRWLARRAHHGLLIAAALIWQLLFTAVIHYRVPVPGPLSIWLSHPGTWLASYLLYVVVGVLAASHFEQVRSWVDAHRRAIGAASVAVAVAGVASYWVDVHLAHLSPIRAGEVFSPVVVVESMAAIAGQFAFGLWVAERATGSARRRLRTASDLSFGVYLAHPLVYQGLVGLLGAVGLRSTLRDLPTGMAFVALLAVVVPSVYALSATGVWLLRRTPASLALTGRRAGRTGLVRGVLRRQPPGSLPQRRHPGSTSRQRRSPTGTQHLSHRPAAGRARASSLRPG